MQQSLALTRPAPAIPRLAGSAKLSEMAANSSPTGDLSLVLAGHATTLVVGLCQVLGDIRVMMTALAGGTQALVIAAVIACVIVLLRVHRRRFAVLRALGAPKAYVFACIWLYVVTIVATGATAGLIVGFGGSYLAGLFVASQTGVALSPSIGLQEVSLAAGLVAIGCVFAVVPAAALYRDRLDRALQTIS